MYLASIFVTRGASAGNQLASVDELTGHFAHSLTGHQSFWT